MRASLQFFPKTQLRGAFEHLIDKMQSEGTTVHYKVLRPDFFAISSTNTSGVDAYMRYHAESNGILGFSLFWDNSKGNVSGERIAVLASGSLWASMTGATFIDPPAPEMRVAAAPSPPAERPAPAPSVPQAPARPSEETSSGTGFFVTDAGHVVTNAHVAENCSTLQVRADGSVLAASVLVRDVTNDLALLKTAAAPAKVAKLRIGVRLGEPVAAFGYPLAPILSTSGNFTRGDITALSGIGDDTRYFQISVPVQPGNSGGPLVDSAGNLVGVVTGKLNALKTMVATGGDLPQNVNFAIKGIVLANFLQSNRVTFETGVSGSSDLPAPDLAERARNISVFVRCN